MSDELDPLRTQSIKPPAQSTTPQPVLPPSQIRSQWRAPASAGTVTPVWIYVGAGLAGVLIVALVVIAILSIQALTPSPAPPPTVVAATPQPKLTAASEAAVAGTPLTIQGTGWSDWFLSGWGLGIHQSLYAGSTYQVLHPELGDKYYCSCFRFHVMDPIYF